MRKNATKFSWNSTWHLLIIGVLLGTAFFIRFWDLNNTPPGLLIDEASLGYNAYSLLKTGKDEWGSSLPLTLKSFGDYKPAGYSYLTIPFLKVFGLSIFSVRIVSAISGVIAVFCLYVIGKSIFNKKSGGILAAFLLTIIPWHIYMSRMAWEANVALTLFLIGTVFFLNTQNKYFRIIISTLFYASTMYVYVGYRLLTPLLLFSFLSLFYLNKRVNKKELVVYVMSFFLCTTPLVSEVVFHKGAERFSQVSIFQEKGIEQYINEQRNFCFFQNNKILLYSCYVYWNKPVVLSNQLIKNYLDSFSISYLFLYGDTGEFINNPQHGGLYIWLLPFFLIGLYVLIKQRKDVMTQLVIVWLVVTPVMSALAAKPHFVRSNMVLIPVILVCVEGLLYIYTKACKTKNTRRVYITILIIVSFYSIGSTLVDYFYIYTKKAMAWDEQYVGINEYIREKRNKYDKTYIKKFNRNSYIYTLFFIPIDPLIFQNHSKKNDFTVNSVENLYFTDLTLEKLYCEWIKEGGQRTLYVTDESSWVDPVYTSWSKNGVHKLAYIYDFNDVKKNKETKNKMNCL